MYCIIIALSIVSSLLPCKVQTAGTSSSQDFTFTKSQSFLKVDPEWPLQAAREVTFHFRTERPHGLLFYHGLPKLPPGGHPHYEMYLMLEKARLKVIHVFHKDGLSNSYFVGKGLNKDKWHKVRLVIKPATGELVVVVDNIGINETLSSLKENPNYNLGDDISVKSFMYFGGTDPYEPGLNLQYNYVRFIGCIGDIKFGHSGGEMQNVPVDSYSQVVEGCIDRCEDEDRCLHHGKCVNHYEFTSCDCFGTGHEGPTCASDSITTVTLRGYSYFTYRIYYWRDRVQSEANMLSILFKTYVQDSVLLYGAGEHHDNYMAISIFSGELYFEINFGDGPLNTTLGYSLHDEIWHNLTMTHHGRIVKVILDNKHTAELEVTEMHHHLHFDPEVYIGSAPSNAKGLKSNKKFVGCLKDIYINRQNVLYSLHDGDSSSVRHYGVFLVEYGCSVVDIIPITFRLPGSRLLLTQDHNTTLDLSLEFKTSQRESLLASGGLQIGNEYGFWQVAKWQYIYTHCQKNQAARRACRNGMKLYTCACNVNVHLERGTAFFDIWTNSIVSEKKWMISEGTHLSNDDWHQVHVKFNNGNVDLIIDFRLAASGKYDDEIQFLHDVYIGGSMQDVTKGFVGCMRDIYLQKQWIDPRDVVGTERAKGKVSLDNCQLVNPCNNPQACEHGGKCFVENGDTKCNCADTGYTGKTCHFSIYKRTCEELYLVGYRNSKIYKTDIDRNGPLPPAFVECDMNEEGYIVTRVETNMPSEMVIRKKGMENFYFDITYQDFTAPLLQALITHSKQCTQAIKYECFKMPLGLRTYTWMESSAGGEYVTNIGSNIVSGRCPCSQNQECANASLFCNCDSRDARWRTDESTFTDPRELGITRVYVLQPKDVSSDAEARLSIGPLECVETDTQQYVITFKTPVSSVEVPGWYRGDMAFSFRTSNSKAVLVYQAAVHSQHGYFRVLLIDDYWLSFEFTVNGNPQTIKVHSRRKLNSGEWQQVWVDHDTHHMRFTVNLDSEMIDLGEEEEAGPFEGPLYVGGVPKHYAGNSAIKEGFIGCFRGLIIGDDVVNLHEHLIKSSPDIVVNCQPSCSPNPCKNDATCLEYWGSYECKCVNPVAHSGKNCENNINANGMTFLSSNSFYHNTTKGIEVFPMSPILSEDILLNFRTYEESALLLYANDHLHNFVQLHFKDELVIFTFNSNRSVVQGSVKVPGISQGQPIQIKVSREKGRTIFLVNSQQTIIQKPIEFIKTYYQDPWLEGKELEIVKPPRGILSILPHSAMFLGGVGLGTVSYLPGFVGCMRGLKIGNSIFNLDEAALNPTSLKGQVRAGCTMMCDKKPCFNGGICIENWKTNTTSCDCLLTSYTGTYCEQDIGGSFDGEALVVYPFHLPPTAPDTVLIRISFSTSGNDIGSRMAILFIQIYQSTRYIFIALTTEGSLLIEENRGDIGAIQSLVTQSSSSFTDKRRHWIYYKRNINQVKIIVDGEEYKYFIKEADSTDGILFDSSTAIVGSPPKMRHKFRNYENFTGCISSLAIELGGLQLPPLDTTFGYTKGALDKVKAENTPTEAKCVGFTHYNEDPSQEKSTLAHSNLPLPSPVPQNFELPRIKSMASTLIETVKTSIHVAVVMSIFLGFVLFCLFLYIWKLQKEYKRRQLREEMIFFQGRRSTQSKAMNFTTPERYIETPSDTKPVATTEDENITAQNDQLNAVEDSEKQPLINNDDSMLNPQDSPYHNKKEEMPASSELSLQPSSSQELEWDPAADNADLITAMDEMNPNDSDDSEITLEENENLGPLRSQILRNAPLASASEVTINRLSQTFI